MADVFLGQLMLVPFNFAPQGWATCSGQLLPISQNTALFSLLGTQYGGDGRSTFGLPNLQGRVPVGVGPGPGLSTYNPGDTGGTQTETLQMNEMPLHDHLVQGGTFPAANQNAASGNSFGQPSATKIYVPGTPALNAPMNPSAIAPQGGNQPHNNLMPYLTMTWIIAMQGIFPSRS